MVFKTKEEVLEILDHLAQLLELRGENPFKIRAYQRAARALENLSEPLERLLKEERLGEVEGIGKAIEEKVTELVTTGHLPYYEELVASFPATLFELFELQGLGAKKIKILYDKLKVDSIVALQAACESGKVAELAGFGEKSATNILKAISFYQEHAGLFRIDEVTPLAEKLLEELRGHPDVGQCQAAGSFRRCKEALGDLDLLVSSKKPEAVSQFFVQHPLVKEILSHGPTKSSVRLEGGLQCDLRVVKSEEFPFASIYFTGNKEHNIRLRNRALERGWSLNEYRYTVRPGAAEPPPIHDEKEFYASLGLAYILPELREDRGEIAAAEIGKLPKLLEWTELRGTFHCHTTASDGKSTLREMALAAQELGLDYLGIADHSKSSHQANGLTEERLLQQQQEIEKLNKELSPFHLFSGTECDILKDGALDFSDEVLASLDYVVASVHSSFQLSEAAMTDRIIRAIQNPYVTMLGHLTGRRFFSRDPYPVNIPAVIEAAAATGTMIELNASPYRLDMDWRWWSLAKEKGVKCVINPDAHSTQGLHNLKYGCLIARKGWLTKEDVVNTRSLEKIIPLLEGKRQRDK
ncbi:MAG: DNA polymerase/3'-5' exonuclease PolX [Verrucomicrobia bacterium]|nr:DNA polymerase/3'-5' exonuclease PolX [Verrucomicrobiota bacterium]